MMYAHDPIPHAKLFPVQTFRYTRWRGGLLVIAVLTACCASLVSQGRSDDGEIGQKFLRIDVNPFIGYRTNINFPTIQNVQGVGPTVTLDANPSYGIAVGPRLDELDLIEIRWSRQKSNVHLQGIPTPSSRVVLDQIQGDFTHEFILDTWPDSVRPFITGSVGGTHIGNGNNSFTRFSFGLGGGLKIFFNRHVGVKMQAEWLPIVINPEVATVFCAGGCVVHLTATAVSQGEAMIGPVFRF